MYYLIIKDIFNCVIQNKGQLCITREDQLLLYVKREIKVVKSRKIYKLEIGFILLNKRNEPMIFVLIKYAVKGIRKIIVHTALSINICKIKRLYNNVSGI